MKIANIDVTKLDKSAFHKGAKGTYTDLIFFENRDGQPDQYGNLGFVTQGISKERRDAGERGPIVGNFKDTDMRPIPEQHQAPANLNADSPQGDDIPF